MPGRCCQARCRFRPARPRSPVPDFRRAQGKKRSAACVLNVHVLVELANMKGCLAAAQFAKVLSQKELATIDAWRIPRTELREPVSKSTIHRVVHSVDPRGARRRGRSLERGPAYPCPGARRRRQAHPRCQPQRLDCVFSVKGNAPETFGILDSIDLERDADGRSTEDP